MTFQQLASVDLNALSKSQLRSYVKLARANWNRVIDLRSATSADMIEYLTMHLTWKAAAEDAVTSTEEEVMAVTDWTNVSPLTCDVCSGQLCDLPVTQEELTEALLPLAHDFEEKPTASVAWQATHREWVEGEEEVPPNFNKYAEDAIATLLDHGTAHGSKLNSDWIRGIVWDCAFIATEIKAGIGQVKERQLLNDDLYYKLAGLPSALDNYSLDKEQILRLIRGNFDHLQRKLNISGLKERHYCIGGKRLTTLVEDSFLMLTEDDFVTLKAEVVRIIAYFKAVTGDRSYTFYVETETDDGGEECWEVTAQDIDWQAIEEYSESAWIYDRNDDHIRLSFSRWDYAADAFSSFFRLLATRS